MTHRIAWLDVFAERPLAGNALAVVDGADGVDDQTMLAFAKEMDLSETTFVQSTDADGADYRNRIFTIEREIPFAGHPSLGTAVAVARWCDLDEASFVQETEAGLQPIEVKKETERWRAEMVQNTAEFGTELDVEAVMHAAGLNPAEAHQDLAPQVVSTGLPTAIVPLSEPSSLGRVKPDFAAIDGALAGAEPRAGETPNFYPAWVDLDAGEVRARMFSTGAPGGEDPATGSAAGPLGAYLAERAGLERVRIRQGEEMGRPSVLEVEMVEGRPRVGGGVIPVIDGEVSLPG
ncbi:MAG TPA: PhzF family phenazine biosynthesis protein [Solirubrobacterales bacterium]|nr:PhzF family phenazine biosynthesis protein [Solirubrobacterales bacterium]